MRKRNLITQKYCLAFLFILNDLASILLCILTDILQTGVFFNKKKPQLLFVAKVADTLPGYLLVVITFPKADAERLRLIKREFRLTSD